MSAPPSYDAWRAELLRSAGLGWHPHAREAGPASARAQQSPRSQLPVVPAASPRPSEEAAVGFRETFRQAEEALEDVRERFQRLQQQAAAPSPPVPSPPAQRRMPARSPRMRAATARAAPGGEQAAREAAAREILDEDLLAAAAEQLEDVRRQLMPSRMRLQEMHHLLRPSAAALLAAPEQPEPELEDEADIQNEHFVRASSRLVRRTFSKKNGLKQRQLRHLRSVRPSSLTPQERADPCVICQCALCDEDDGESKAMEGELIVVLRCSHCFHEECVKQWLTRSSICPVCRAPAARKRKPRKPKEEEEGGGGAPRSPRYRSSRPADDADAPAGSAPDNV